MRYSIYFISAALICLVVGEGIGIWMGTIGDFTAKSRLALTQFLIATLEAIVLPCGIAYVIATNNDIVAIVGSLIVLIGTLLFGFMFARHAGKPA